GTVLVKDINPGSGATFFGYPATVNGTQFFSANVGTGATLWQSNGTAAGTVLVANLVPGPLSTGNGTLFFSADDGVHGTELWALSAVPTPSLDVSGFPATTIAGSASGMTITAKNAAGTA